MSRLTELREKYINSVRLSLDPEPQIGAMSGNRLQYHMCSVCLWVPRPGYAQDRRAYSDVLGFPRVDLG